MPRPHTQINLHGLLLLAFGPHHDADGEPVDDSWTA
jgi:hypothetical protein